MAIALGMENKRQVYLVGSLFAVVIAIAAWEIFGGSSTPARLPAPSNSAGSQHASGPARRSGVAGLEPKLQVGRLARSEQVEYATTGRNIFSGESAPVKIEVPVASPRPNDTGRKHGAARATQTSGDRSEVSRLCTGWRQEL